MNQQLWEQHLMTRIKDLRAELVRQRVEAKRQKKRAEMWKHRALKKSP